MPRDQRQATTRSSIQPETKEIPLKNLFAAVLVSAAIAAPAAAADSYTVDPAHTYPNFEVNHLGFSVMHGQVVGPVDDGQPLL